MRTERKRTGSAGVIGLTGGIASGKTTVVRELRKLGARVVEADRISRDVVRPGTPALARIVKTFGRGILNKDGTLDRAALARIVFDQPKKRKALERIVHPAIRREIRAALKEYRSDGRRRRLPLILDMPLLYEAGLERWCDRVLVVWSTAALQKERLASRNGLSGREITARLSSQWPLAEKKARADYVINNTGTIRSLRSSIKKLWGVLTKVPE